MTDSNDNKGSLLSKGDRQRLLQMSFYDFTTTTSDGEECHMNDFRGKVVYIVNTASQWGRTWTEFSRFVKLHQTWGSAKLQILGFPSLEFGKQEFTTDEEVLDFAKRQEFPGIMMKLGKVQSTETDCQELWNFLRVQTGAPDPTWNFASKFLISKTGKVSASAGNISSEIAALIEQDDA